MKEYFQTCLESILAFINPEAFKKYKERTNGHADIINEQFEEELKKSTGLSVDEFKSLAQNSRDEGIEFPEDPFLI